MEHFFSLDGPLYRWMNLIWQLMILNLLLIVTSLPIVTIGASQIAGFTVATKLINKEAIPILATFFESFKKNWKQGCLVTILGLFFSGILLVNWQYFQVVEGFSLWLLIGCGIVTLLFANIMQFVFFYMSRYEDSFKTIFMNLVKILLKYPIQSFGLLVIWLLPIFLMMATPYLFIFGCYVGIFFGVALLLFIRSFLLVRFFKKIEVQTINLQNKETIA